MIQLIHGGALEELQKMESESIHCCVTSPPYWGLRDYGVEGQLGLEKTPEEYIAKMLAVFAEVRRVLRKDGTCWVNIGDTYTAGGRNRGNKRENNSAKQLTNIGSMSCGPIKATPGYKPKDLVGIPWMLAFALRADGWYLRQDIIWAKPNPMPESVRDRCTRAHDYVFLLTKSAKYYFDAQAIKERGVIPAGTRGGKGSESRRNICGVNARPAEYKKYDGMRNKRSVWTVVSQAFADAHFATFPPKLIEPCILAGCPPGGIVLDPFIGSGTTALVARWFDRSCIGIELNGEYLTIARRRLRKHGDMLTDLRQLNDERGGQS